MNRLELRVSDLPFYVKTNVFTPGGLNLSFAVRYYYIS